MDGEERDESSFGVDEMGLGFEMPDFSQIGKTMRMMSWIPAIFSGFATTVISFVAHVIIVGVDFAEPFPWISEYNMTYGYFMVMVLLSLILGGFVGALVKYNTDRRMGGGLF